MIKHAKRRLQPRVALASAILAGSIAAWPADAAPVDSPASAASGDAGATDEASPARGAKPQPSDAKPRRRLPPHYSKVVRAEQRAKIYQIQDRYGDKIVLLEAKIAELKSAMAREIEAVLSPEQRAQLKQLKDAAAR